MTLRRQQQRTTVFRGARKVRRTCFEGGTKELGSVQVLVSSSRDKHNSIHAQQICVAVAMRATASEMSGMACHVCEMDLVNNECSRKV